MSDKSSRGVRLKMTRHSPVSFGKETGLEEVAGCAPRSSPEPDTTGFRTTSSQWKEKWQSLDHQSQAAVQRLPFTTDIFSILMFFCYFSEAKCVLLSHRLKEVAEDFLSDPRLEILFFLNENDMFNISCDLKHEMVHEHQFLLWIDEYFHCGHLDSGSRLSPSREPVSNCKDQTNEHWKLSLNTITRLVVVSWLPFRLAFFFNKATAGL